MPCSNATSDNCAARPEDEAASPATKCWRCSKRVCGPCSSIRTISVSSRRVRVCDNCLASEPDGEAKVLLRRYHERGSTDVDLAGCRAELAAKRAVLAAARYG